MRTTSIFRLFFFFYKGLCDWLGGGKHHKTCAFFSFVQKLQRGKNDAFIPLPCLPLSQMRERQQLSFIRQWDKKECD